MNERSFFKTYPPETYELYNKLLRMIKGIGPYKAEVKKASIHLVNARAFAGIHPKKSYLGVNLVLSRARANPMADKVAQVSKNRFHNSFRSPNCLRWEGSSKGW